MVTGQTSSAPPTPAGTEPASAGTDPRQVADLVAELTDLLGPQGVSTDARVLERVAVDGARLSPILTAQLPLGHADLVAYPRNAEQIGMVVAAAVRHGVPITPRGKGTGNYGQGIPMRGGLVLDTTRAKAVLAVEQGALTAEAGALMLAVETAAHATGQELWMYPSTVQSTIGGFLSGGSGGTGSIAHGVNHLGFVAALDVVHATGEPDLVHVQGAQAQPYVHTYGTAGIIARATVRLEPAVDWAGTYTSFPDFHQALAVLRPLAALDPTPRLVSADLPAIAAALPADPAIPPGRASLRAILHPDTLTQATRLVERAGGRVDAVRYGPRVVIKMSMLSYNHPIEWLQKRSTLPYFHVEVSGHALIDRIDQVHAVYPGGMLHIEAQRDAPIGMLAAPYTGPEQVYAGFDVLAELGVGVHDCHQWYVDHEVDATRALAARTDPARLLNPGKLV